MDEEKERPQYYSEADYGAGKKQLLEQKAKLNELFDSALHRSMNSRQVNQWLNPKNCVIL